MGTGKIYSLEDTILFGKHKGEPMADIIDHDIGYVTYLIEEQEFELDNEAYEYYTKNNGQKDRR
jgi:hypothetical protein